jgi:hypothetical protein
MIDHERRQLGFGGPVEATVDATGDIAVTRGRNLMAKGVGGVVLAGAGVGALGLLAFGNAKHRTVDNRELYLLVEGPGWAYVGGFDPALGASIRKFAALVNVTAKRHLDEPAPSAEPREGDDVVGQLARLAGLHESGVLTAAEFGAAKAKLLGL